MREDIKTEIINLLRSLIISHVNDKYVFVTDGPGRVGGVSEGLIL